MATDYKASQLDPVSVPRNAAWAGYEEVGGVKQDVLVRVSDIRPGVSAYGMRLALGANLRTVADAIGPDITAGTTIRWQAAARISTGDPLFLLIKSTLGYSDAQMTILMTAAAAYE